MTTSIQFPAPLLPPKIAEKPRQINALLEPNYPFSAVSTSKRIVKTGGFALLVLFFIISSLYAQTIPVNLSPFSKLNQRPAYAQFTRKLSNTNGPVGSRKAAPEICDNGLDDDGDGFIDRFDSDCPCATTDYGSYVSNCAPSCSYQFVAQPFTIAQQWSSAPNVSLSYSTPLVADLDNDGVSEIIVQTATGFDSSPRVSKNIFILNGEDGTLQNTITTPFMDWSSTVVIAIADVDHDGFGEIIVASSTSTNAAADQTYLYCYERDGTLLWKSNVPYAAYAVRSGGAPGIADFNHDGIAEVYIYNEIFNAQTGVKLADGGANGIGSTVSFAGIGTWANSVAADFIPSSPALELAAGRTVYSVSITSTTGTVGNTMTATNLPSALDGLTSAADINLDGVLDVVVTPRSATQGLYVWDARTATLIASQTGTLSGSDAGMAFIGDVDNDGDPDLGYCRVNRLYMLSYNGTTTLANKWVLTTSDASGVTGMSMFDFNGDGKAEIIYRDETRLRIIDGSTATPTNLAVINSASGTALEMPVVADIDNDGQAEIVIGDQTGLANSGTGYMKAYKSNGQPWSPARNVWNQLGYHNTNIDDQLKVPTYEQNYSLIFTPAPGACTGLTQRPLNNFLQQASPRDRNGCLAYPSSDAVVSNVSIACGAGNTVVVTYTITNNGEAALDASTPIRFYAGDPLTTTGALFSVTATVGSVLQLGQSKIINTTVDYTGTATPFNLFVSVNDDGLSTRPFTFPTTAIPECSYGNNVSSIEVVGLNIGGSVYLDATGLADGINGTLANGPALGPTGLHMTLLVGTTGSTQQAVQPIDATGKFLFTNVPEGTYRLVLGTTATGSAVNQLPTGYYTVGEGGPLVSGFSSGDGTNNGITSITIDCNGITYGSARMAANIDYLENNFAIVAAPDLTPITYARPSTVYGTTNLTVVVDVVELNNLATSGLITVKLTKDANVSLVFSQTATTVNGRAVQNGDWTYVPGSDPNYYVLTTSKVIAAGGVLSFGFTGNLTPGATSGGLTASSAIVGFSGGEVKVNNNVDADKVDYFQQ